MLLEESHIDLSALEPPHRDGQRVAPLTALKSVLLWLQDSIYEASRQKSPRVVPLGSLEGRTWALTRITISGPSPTCTIGSMVESAT
jgi:hypothetical protein